MKIQIRANDYQKQVILSKKAEAEIIFNNENIIDADAFVDFLYNENDNFFETILHKTVIVNEVISNKELGNNFSRINAWNTFIEKDKLELHSFSDNKADEVLDAIGYKSIAVPNIVGLIAARNIAMIINEAYFGLQDEISTKEQIDIAMKLGTNYPYGPFEWEEKIGKKNIVNLLTTLSKTDSRYTPCSLLMQ